MSKYAYLFKYIIIGESNVGKSCLMLQFTDNKFKQENDPTIGVEFGSKTIASKGKTIKLQIWDTAGQESFRSITRSYFRGAIGALLTFDITSRESFDAINGFVEETSASASTNLVIVLIGNKSDLASERQVSQEEAQTYAKKLGLVYIEVSAKTSHNVSLAFEMITEKILEKIENKEINPEEELGIKMGNKGDDQQSLTTKVQTSRDNQGGALGGCCPGN